MNTKQSFCASASSLVLGLLVGTTLHAGAARAQAAGDDTSALETWQVAQNGVTEVHVANGPDASSFVLQDAAPAVPPGDAHLTTGPGASTTVPMAQHVV